MPRRHYKVHDCGQVFRTRKDLIAGAAYLGQAATGDRAEPWVEQWLCPKCQGKIIVHVFGPNGIRYRPWG